MPFYIRKSVSVGPFRFNLSKSGIGVSAGIKGLRVGTGPRGAYVHMGRGGLYYRASLGSGRTSTSQAPRQQPAQAFHQSQPQSVPIVHTPSATAPAEQVETGNLLDMAPSKVSDIIDQINEKAALGPRWPWVLLAGVILAIVLAFQDLPNPTAISGFWPWIVFIITLGLSIHLYRQDKLRRMVVVMYDMEDDAQKTYKDFIDQFDLVARSAKTWNVETSATTQDWKRNAGATELLKRGTAVFGYKSPNVVTTNISAPSIIGGRLSIYFFPDVLLIEKGKSYAALSYGDFDVQWGTVQFIEEEGVPSDSRVIRQTWKYLAKNGGPDRRFKNNHQIPVAQYQAMEITGRGDLRKLLYLSRVDERGLFNKAMHDLKNIGA